SGNPWPTDEDGQLFLDKDFIESEIMPNLNIEQNRAFSVRVNFTTSFLISVRGDAASWLYEDHLINVDVSLSGLPDPLYVMKTKQTFGPDWQFNNTIVEDSKPIRTRQETLDFYRRMYYSAAPGLGPSYFQRLVNSHHTSDCCGIESFVNINRIFSGATINQTRTALPNNWFNRSNVDHKYFYYNIPRGENLFSCREIVGQNERQLYSFASLESPFGNPTFFNLDTFYAERYSLPEHFGGSLCQFSRECLLDTSCTPQQTPAEE
ncbi:MAG: hypothetical protein ACOCUR_02740, partial [Nanoarchaeota archaeon]